MPDRIISPDSAGGILNLLPPFPVVLVTTRSNIITIGQIEYFTFSPLRIGIAVAHTRHTYLLLKKEHEFVINVPEAEMVEAVKVCGSISGRDCDKFEVAGVTAEASLEVQAVSIAECRAHVECRIEREIEFERRTWFIGIVVAARCQEGFKGKRALLCGRNEYVVPGDFVAER